MSSDQLPWKIGAMESGRVAIDDAQDRQVTGWLEPEDAERILKAVNAHDDLLDALQAFPGFLCGTATGDAWIEQMRAAIAKARGES
jgi:hypothetical protein